MKVISIWQPYATLAVLGHKTIETRTWPAPQSIIGQRIGIASTKNIKPEQRAAVNDPTFQKFYQPLGLGSLDELPRGFLLGTAILDSIELMTEEMIEDVSDEEQAYGYWTPGNWAWRLTNSRPLSHPIPIRGAQGIYEWHGELTDEGAPLRQDPAGAPNDQEGSDHPGRLLRVVR